MLIVCSVVVLGSPTALQMLTALTENWTLVAGKSFYNTYFVSVVNIVVLVPL